MGATERLIRPPGRFTPPSALRREPHPAGRPGVAWSAAQRAFRKARFRRLDRRRRARELGREVAELAGPELGG